MSTEKQTDSQTTSDPAVASSDLLGAMYRGSDGAMTCALCHCEMEWEHCGDCGGEGWNDAYEDDPNYYQPEDTKPCHMCDGRGGSWWCETKDCKTATGCKTIEAPKAPNAGTQRPGTSDAEPATRTPMPGSLE